MMVAVHGSHGPLRSLWRRAPLWRFVLMSAGLLSLSFVLFPPKIVNIATPATLPVAQEAAYEVTPQTRKRQAAAAAEAAAASRLAAVQKPVRNVAQPEDNHDVNGKPLQQAFSEQKNRADAPKIAELALATASGGDAKANISGVDNALLGRTYQHSIIINGFKLPLPPGDWAMLSRSGLKDKLGATGTAVFFGRVEHKRLVGVIRVYSLRSEEKSNAGFESVRGCAKGNPNNIYESIEAVTPFDHQACWVMHNYFTPPWQQWADRNIKISNLEKAAAGNMTAKGITYPQDLVGIDFIRAEKWGLVEAQYMFSPEVEGISSNTVLSFSEADWNGRNISRFPEKQAYAAKLKRWATDLWPTFQSAFSEAGQPIQR